MMETCILCLLLVCAVQYTNGDKKTVRQTITESEYQDTIASSQVSFIYFYVSNSNNEFMDFLTGFYEASDYLKDFKIALSVVDCNTDYIQGYCNEKEETLMAKVFVYRNGETLTDLATDTLFDINSIVSSALHLALLQDVPIVQNHQELKSLLNSAKGKQDVIFSKVMAIGTPEHRAFMEAAFAYGHRYRFLVTTSDENVLKESDVELWDATRDGVWLFQCHQTLIHEDCPRIMYRGVLRVNEFPSFMKALDMPLISKIENGGSSLHRDLKMPTVILLTKCKKFPEADEAITEVADQYLGSVGFVIVDRDFVDPDLIPSLRVQPSMHQNSLPYILMDPGRSDNAEFFQMNEDITAENLSTFIDNVLGETVPDYEDDDDEIYDDKDVSVEDIQDDPVQEAIFYERVQVIDITHAQELTDKTFPEFIARNTLTTILFFVKWDPRCMAFMEPYTLAAKEIMEIKGLNESALAQVNCFDWPDVCQKANVTRYPIIKMYRRSNEVAEYRGVLDEFSFLKFYLLSSVDSPMVMMKEQEGRDFMGGDFPSWSSKYLDALTIGMFPEGTAKERVMFNDVANELQGHYLMASCVKNCAEVLATEIGGSEATVVTIKWEDVNQPEVVYDQPFSASGLEKFVLESSEKIMPELTVVNLPFYLKKKSTFMILFHGSDQYSESAEQDLADIARDETFPNVQFCWLDASSSETIGIHLLKEYDLKFVRFRPTFVLLDFASHNLYHYSESIDYRKSAFVSWMEKALKGEIDSTLKLQEKQWKPLLSGYDFLSMIRQEEETEKARNRGRRSHDYSESSEEDSLSTGEDEDNMLGDLPTNDAQRHEKATRQSRNDLRGTRSRDHSESSEEDSLPTGEDEDKILDDLPTNDAERHEKAIRQSRNDLRGTESHDHSESPEQDSLPTGEDEENIKDLPKYHAQRHVEL